MKLELKHLAPYLPYKLTAEMIDYKCDYVGKKYDEIVGVHQWDKSGLLWCVLTVGCSKPSLDKIKPILRPLSDLTKEIEHNGEKFVPLEKLFKMIDNSDYIEFLIKNELLNCDLLKMNTQIDDDWNHVLIIHSDESDLEFHYSNCSFGLFTNWEHLFVSNLYELLQKLFELHFDVFGLIENKLAIDINTLNQQP